MKNFCNSMKNKINGMCIKAKCKAEQAKDAVMNTSGEGYVDTGVKIIIAVVVGSVILGGLYALFSGVILPKMNTEISGMFDHTA